VYYLLDIDYAGHKNMTEEVHVNKIVKHMVEDAMLMKYQKHGRRATC